jgi:hypothetical protein
MNQLSNTQILIHSGAAATVASAVIAKGLPKEVDADLRNGGPIWREPRAGHGTTLKVAKAGLYAMGIEAEDWRTPAAGADESATPASVRDTAPGHEAAPKARTPARGDQEGRANRDAARARGCDDRPDRRCNRLASAHGLGGDVPRAEKGRWASR